MHTTLLVMSGLMAVGSYASLIWDLVKNNKAQPLATRLALCFALSLGGISVVIAGGTPGDIVIAVTYACLSLAVVILSVFKETTAITRRDMICLGISGLGATAFVLSGESTVGIMFAIGADLVAYWPTICVSWCAPYTQPVMTYLIGLAAAGFALTAAYVQGGIHVSSAFTIYLVAIDCCLPAVITYRRVVKRVALERVA